MYNIGKSVTHRLCDKLFNNFDYCITFKIKGFHFKLEKLFIIKLFFKKYKLIQVTIQKVNKRSTTQVNRFHLLIHEYIASCFYTILHNHLYWSITFVIEFVFWEAITWDKIMKLWKNFHLKNVFLIGLIFSSRHQC